MSEESLSTIFEKVKFNG